MKMSPILSTTLALALAMFYPNVSQSQSGGADSISSIMIENSKNDRLSGTRGTKSDLQFNSIANTCHGLRHGGNIAIANDTDEESQYYLKPAALGEYILYHESGGSLYMKDGMFRLRDEIDEGSVFEFIEYKGDLKLMHKESKRFIKSERFLFFRWSGSTSKVSKAGSIDVSPEELCMNEFPEAKTGAEVVGKLKTRFSNGDLYGIADIHNHMAAEDLAAQFGIGGKAFSPYGIESAIGSCAANHGNNGQVQVMTAFFGSGEDLGVDLEDKKLSSLSSKKQESKSISPGDIIQHVNGHEVEGYPYFKDWPKFNDAGHGFHYYKWMDRARLGGLRLMTVYSTNSNAACKIGREFGKIFAGSGTFPDLTRDEVGNRTCDGNELHVNQMEKMYQLEDYIDAQNGGKDKGWMEIVTSPKEARKAVGQGRLAIVLGAEIDDLFNCVLGAENPTSCSFQHIEDSVEELYQQGVRAVFPSKHYSTYFSGAQHNDGQREMIQLVHNGTSSDWEVCENGREEVPFLSQNSREKMTDIERIGFDLLLLGLGSNQSNLKHYPEDLPENYGYCNSAGLTDKGEFLIHALMKRGMMIDLDHTGRKSIDQVTELTERFDYPRLATHKDDITPVSEKYYENQGMISPLTYKFHENGKRICEHPVSTDFIERNKVFADKSKEIKGIRAIAFSTDFSGSVPALGPRFNEEVNKCVNYDFNTKVDYPFYSFDKKVKFEKQKTGFREFDYNTDGFAHYGMLPDMVRDLQSQGYTRKEIKPLFLGAESYIRTWEQAVKQSKAVRKELN